MVEKQLDKQNQPEGQAAQTATAAALHSDAYADHPGFFARTWNVTKSIARGAADRLSDDVVHFSEHPWRSTAEIAGTTVAAGAAVVASVEVGAAVATYAGVATLSTEMGALFGAGTAAGIIGPGADALASTTVSDWKATAGARDIVADPAAHTVEQVSSAQRQIGQTLGRDALSNAALYGGLATGAVAGELTMRAVAPRAAEPTLSDNAYTSTKPFIKPEIANDNIPSGIERDAQGRLKGNWSKSSFNLSYNLKTGAPDSVRFGDGDNRYAFSRSGAGADDKWSTIGNPSDKATVTVDNKTGVKVYYDGDEFKFGADGTQTIERFNGYKETSDSRYPGAEGIRSLKIPNNGPEITQSMVGNGQSQLTMIKDGKTFVSEPGNADAGWEFKAQNGQSGPGENGEGALIKLTKETLAKDFFGNEDRKHGWAVSIENTDGSGSRMYDRSGWQRSVLKDGDSTTMQVTDASDNVKEAEVKNGNMTRGFRAVTIGGRSGTIETYEVPGASIWKTSRGHLSLTEGGVETNVKNLRELSDARNPNRTGFSVDMPDGTTRAFWSDSN